ncbi:hypothetical protein [Mycetocola zhadangensis]|uniref:hypothetical protein n=1 Tax=Mycetocola zhadangensis TaxID=1164595 RepID=UPI003A4D6877
MSVVTGTGFSAALLAAGFAARGVRDFAVDVLRAGAFFGAELSTSADASAALDADGAAFVVRVAGFFFAAVVDVERGFAGVRSFDALGATGASDAATSASDVLPLGRGVAPADSLDGPGTGTLFAGSSGVSSGEAGGTVVTDPTYQLPVAYSRRMPKCSKSEPVKTPSALLRYDNNKRPDTAPNTGAALT